jgi:23S rRNA pseudouridine1911/1915/1917 synthase
MPVSTRIEAEKYSPWDEDDFEAGAGADASGEPATLADAGTPLTLVAGAEADGSRLDKWLAGRLPHFSRSRLQRWIEDGHVIVNERVAAVRDAVWRDDEVRIAPQPSESDTAFAAEDVPLVVVYEDDDLLVVDKPPGLVVHPAAGNWHGTLLNGLLYREPTLAHVPRAGIVHRLDKDTSGLMVVAKTLVAQTDLVRQLQARTVGRTYIAIVQGAPPPSGRVAWPIGRDPRERTRMAAFKVPGDPPPGTKPAATRFETRATVPLPQGAPVSLVVCRLETGRTHQIRVHLQAIGHPLVGDPTYGRAKAMPAFGRQALHAWQLALVHPTTRQSMAWTAAVPADLATLASSLGIDLDAALARPFADG